MRLLKRLNAVEEKMDTLMAYVPKLYYLMAHSKPAYPCEMYRNEVCSKCLNRSCIHHPCTIVETAADEIITEFIKTVEQDSRK